MIFVELSIVAMISVELSIVAKTTNLQNVAFRICANFRRKLRPFFSSDYRYFGIMGVRRGRRCRQSPLLFVQQKKIQEMILMKNMK